MSRALISLDVIANDLSGDLSDSNYNKKATFTRHLLAGYRRLTMFLAPSQKTVKTEILAFENCVQMPCDFLYVTKVGVRRPGNPCIAILTLCNNVERRALNDTDCCDYLNSVWSGGYGGPGYTFYNAWGYGNYYGELYGMGRTIINNGTYSIDKGTGTIYLGSNIPVDSEIIVEYVSDIVSSGVQYVPVELKECLEFYALWKFFRARNPSLSDTNYEMYKKEYNILKRYYNHVTPLQMALAVNAVISPTNY